MKIKIESSKDTKELAKLNRTVQNLHYELFPSEFKPFDLTQVEKAFSRLLSQPNTYAFIARDEQKAVGYLLCFIKNRDENEFQFSKTVMEIDQISVEKPYRNLGIAKQLLNRVISFAEEKEISEIQLNHWEGNSEASRFFIKNGFQYFYYRMKRNN